MHLTPPLATAVVVLALAACGGGASATAPAPGTPTFENGDVRLAYSIDLPPGRGPFPGVVFGHGPGRLTRHDLQWMSSRFTSGDGWSRSGPRRADKSARDVAYVGALRINGRNQSRVWLPESFARDGGTLRFTLSATPVPAWGAAPADAPPSFPPPR